MRLIDADALIAKFESAKEGSNLRDTLYLDGVQAVIDNAPTIASTRDWTPCAEGLPTKTADYKVTVQVGSEMGTWRETKIIPYRIVDGVGEWILPKSDWLIYGVIAWTKADEPWTGGLDGK